jgi:hypothetical protein
MPEDHLSSGPWERVRLPQHRINARPRLNECLRPCRVDYAKSGSSKDGQTRCVGVNFDTPTSPLRFSVDAIATIMFGSSGHWPLVPRTVLFENSIRLGRGASAPNPASRWCCYNDIRTH